jgi:hypothetical protein
MAGSLRLGLLDPAEDVLPVDAGVQLRVVAAHVPRIASTTSSSDAPRATWPHSQLISFAVRHLLRPHNLYRGLLGPTLEGAWDRRACVSSSAAAWRSISAAAASRRACRAARGGLLFVYLAVHRLRAVTRDELAEAVWPAGAPAARDTALNALLSKLRRLLGAELLPARGDPRLLLPPDAWVDLEAARDAAHRAESAAALGAWPRAWRPPR